MYQISGLKLLRLLTGRTLASLGRELGNYKRSHLSQCEKDPSDCGPKLRKKLQELYLCDWPLLSKQIDASAIAVSIVKLSQKKAPILNAK